MSEENAIAVFTARSPDRIVKEGGSQAWVLNPARAKQCAWLICTQNRNNPDHEFSDATEPHGSAFLVAKISALVPSGNRWMIAISEYARINIPNVWAHWRNPVRYTSLKDLGISLDGIEFEEMTARPDAPPPSEPHSGGSAPGLLTIPEAKKALALTFGVKPEAVEITIRG